MGGSLAVCKSVHGRVALEAASQCVPRRSGTAVCAAERPHISGQGHGHTSVEHLGSLVVREQQFNCLTSKPCARPWVLGDTGGW